MIPLATIENYISQAVNVPGIVISCDSSQGFLGGAVGFTTYGPDGQILKVIHITQSECVQAENVDHPRLRVDPSALSLVSGGRIDKANGANVLGVIEHEAMHIALQSNDESLVECTAYQNRWAFVKLFGFPSWVSQIVMNTMTWRHQNLPDAYRADC